MKKTIVISAIIVMTVATLFSSCKKTNSPIAAPFSAYVNSTSFTGSRYNDSLVKSMMTTPWDTTGVGIKTMYISMMDTQGNNLIVYISDWRDSTIGTGMRLGIYNFNRSSWIVNSHISNASVSALAAYNGVIYLDANSTATGAVTITACDTIVHTVSGTFSGLVPPFSGSGSSLVLGNGTFNKLNYTVRSH